MPPTKTDRKQQQGVVIDRSEFADRARYVCPNGHANWDRTNNHIWCQSCARASTFDNDIDPEHYELIDKKTDQEIPWSAVTVIDRE